MIEDKYIGLALAVFANTTMGISFMITKKGLIDAETKHGYSGEGFSYMKNGLWWAGIVTLIFGEFANFAAYAFAPAILVTPLGALSVLVGAVLGTYFLNEELGSLGKLGCAICLLGSAIIVLHAPADKDVKYVDEILHYAIQPAFLIYMVCVIIFASFMIYKVSPKYGRKDPTVYLSICSAVGSISVMGIKGLGIAVKLTLQGNNQLTHPSTYCFLIVVIVCILVQMNYFNKALSQFSTNIVNPLYYVGFTTCTILASFILFQGFNTTDIINTLSLLCGFLIIFAGVYLLNLSRSDPNGLTMMNGSADGIPTDGITSIQTRHSMQIRRSREQGGRPSGGFHRQDSSLMNAYREEIGMRDLRRSSRGDISDDDTTTSDEMDHDAEERGLTSGKRTSRSASTTPRLSEHIIPKGSDSRVLSEHRPSLHYRES